ncbi:site-specific integrase [Vibrio sp. THAF190c]|uniref:site-specific integrase n=1 Tax=Vibrio sp. THAF190c TaxID=2587865 RepID=UPI001267DBA6|nr:site-specific integrase [Vibrio sp. THAF190c]QFT12976.1 Phage integrase family protein [Vibrio sp. THAF190c]
MTVTYEIKTTEIKPYRYRTPLIAVDDGQLIIEYSKQFPTYIKKLTLLNMVGRDISGNIVSYEPMDHVNRFLMSHHIDENKQESDQYSKGLVHFFSFLIELQKLWDEQFDEHLYDDLVDLPRPVWDWFPPRKSQRITYQYRAALRHAVLNEANPSLRIARTTASAYMNAVVKFYTYHIRNNHEFNNPPFEHEVLQLSYTAGGTSMKSMISKDVYSTDLRLNFGRSVRNEGGAIPTARRDLKPLTNTEWKAVEDILINTQRVIKNIGGELRSTRLPIEYCLFFLIARYTGLRKEEVASLHVGQVVKPDTSKFGMRFGVGGMYGSLTKTKGGGNKSRRTIIPNRIMQLLYEYTLSDRYKKRLNTFKKKCKKEREKGDVSNFEGEDAIDDTKQYLFISTTGKPFFTKLSEANTRWSEIRNTVEINDDIKIDKVIHNLRSTFAVWLFRILLKKTTQDIALALVSECLGHDEEETTLIYLRISQDEPTGDEIYEDILDFLGVFENMDNEFLLSNEGTLSAR